MFGTDSGVRYALSPVETYLVREAQHRLRGDYGMLEYLTLERSQNATCYTIYFRRNFAGGAYEVVFRYDQFGAFLVQG